MKLTDEVHREILAALKEAYGGQSTFIVSTADVQSTENEA